MKHTTCEVMSNCFTKIVTKFFYCKTCDKEFKYPICRSCLDKCHKVHIKSDNIKPNESAPNLCICGYK